MVERSVHGLARACGVLLMLLGAVALVLGLIASLLGSDPGEVGGGALVLSVGTLVGAAGYGLVRVGAAPLGLRPGGWVRRAVGEHRLAVAHVVAGVLLVVFAGGGVTMLATGSDPSAGAMFTGFAVFVAGALATTEIGRRGGGRQAQYLAVGAGLVGAAAIVLAVGVSAEDTRLLLVSGVVCTCAAVGSGVGAARARD